MKFKGIEITQEDVIRFYDKITIITDVPNIGCWNSSLYKSKGNRVRFSIGKFNIEGHRFIYMIHHQDEDIDGKSICHTCDNPWCVNPDHLFSGTHQDNIADMMLKGRNVKGSQVNLSKLTENDVENILKDISDGKFKWLLDVSKKYDISCCTLGQILDGKIWKHVTKNYDINKIKKMIMTDKVGVNNCNTKFTEQDVRDIRQRLKNGESQRSIANSYNVHQTTVGDINRGISYQNVI